MWLTDGLFGPFSGTMENLYIHVDYTSSGTLRNVGDLLGERGAQLTLYVSEPETEGEGEGSGFPKAEVKASQVGYNCTENFCWMKQVCIFHCYISHSFL